MQLLSKPENVILVVGRKGLCLLGCWLLLVAAFPLHLPAQPHRLLFHSLGVNEGLSHSSVYSLLQDSRGFIWLGTADGLNRYDGREIKVYRPAEAQREEEAAYIRSRMVEDREGNIWYLGFAGLFCWDKTTEQVTKRAGISGTATVYFLDEKGELWFHDLLHGISSYNLYTKKRQTYPFPFKFEREKYWNLHVTTDDKRYLWFSVYNNGDYYRFDISTRTYQKLSYNKGVSLLQYENGRLWLSDDKRITVYDAATMQLRSEILRKGVSLHQARLYRDKSRHLWLAINRSGIYCIDEKGNVKDEHRHDNYSSYTISSDNVTRLMEDRTGSLWVATDGGGVSKTSLKEMPFGRFPADEKSHPEVKDLLIWSLYEDRGGRVWFSTDKGGLYIYDPASDEVKEQRIPGIQGQVKYIFETAEGAMWFACTGGLVCVDNGKAGKVLVSKSPAATKAESEVVVVKILPVTKEMFLVVTSQGLRVIEKRSGVWKEKPMEIPNPLFGKLTDVAEAGAGTYWLVSPGHGLILARLDADAVVPLDSFLLRESVKAIHKDEIDRDVAWLASKTGLWKLDIKSRKTKHYNANDGLGNPYLYALLEDANHNIWMSTNGGLSCYHRASSSFTNYTHSNGLQSNEFNSGAYHKGRSGKLYFGGVKGFNWLTEKTTAPDTVIPDLLLTKIALADSLISPFSLRNKTIDLSYRKNYFDLQALVADYTRPEANVIKYRLNGWDKSWQVSQSGEVHYANLAPGSYELEMTGIGSNGAVSKPYLLKVNVIAPFWQQLWFKALVLLMLLSAVVGVIYAYYLRKINRALRELEQQKVLAAERSRISRDLHDDIGSAITKITLISELIPLQQKTDEAVLEDVRKISTTARRVSQSMSDIVWALHAQHDSLEGLLAYMREQIREFLEPLGIKYRLNFPEDVPSIKLNGEQRRNILMVTKEALNNAVKYADAENISVSGKYESGTLEFCVSDDGKGFNVSEAREHGNGLKNMRKRMEGIGGTFHILQPGQGTVIVYSLAV